MSKVRIDCAKGGCREKATQVCNKCDFAFCPAHVYNHDKAGRCSIE